MSQQRHIDTVIFDLGGVLMHNGRHSDFTKRFPPDVAAEAQRIFVGEFGVDTDHPWHRLERGEISMVDCSALQKEAFAAAGIEMPARPVPEPTTDGAPTPMLTFLPNDEMLDLAARLRQAGLGIGILTNNVREFRDLWRNLMPYEELFDDIVDSHEVGLRKPNPAIYELALERLNGTASRAAFLDDLPSNVEAAAALGMFGVLVEIDAAPAIAEVERLAGLV
ncbi:MAG: family phosphatase [Acidimicrobiales bacterium]|nr:family phosphatase [Acidimicrobiales bacterium]